MALKDRAKFEREMQAIKVQENLERIKKRGQIGGQLCKEKREKKRKDAAEKAFEEMLFEEQACVPENLATEPESLETTNQCVDVPFQCTEMPLQSH